MISEKQLWKKVQETDRPCQNKRKGAQMNQRLENIIKRQQEYECFRHFDPAANPDKNRRLQDPFLTDIVLPKLNSAMLKHRRGKIIKIAAMALSGLCIAWTAAAAFTDAPDAEAENRLENPPAHIVRESPAGQARSAINAGDYEKAKKILDDAAAECPHPYYYHDAYAALYSAMDDYDTAVWYLAEFINGYLHAQNMTSAVSPFYRALREIEPESLQAAESLYASCLSQCDAYIARYEKMHALIEQEDYYLALKICDGLKADGAYDLYLADFYYECLTHLKAYDECAQYLLGLYGKKTDLYDNRYPEDAEILHCLEQLKGQVSPDVKSKIEQIKY